MQLPSFFDISKKNCEKLPHSKLMKAGKAEENAVFVSL